MSKEAVLKKLGEVIMNMDEEAARKSAEEALKAGIDPMEAFKAMTASMRKIGELFAKMELFIPDLLMAAEAFTAGSDVLKSVLSKKELEKTRVGTVVIGTVKGDIHDLGKKIVAMTLSAAGFEVHDIGSDQSPENFLSEAEKVNADIIAMSALMSSTIPYMKDTIKLLEDEGVREKYKVILGGGPGVLTPDLADEWGADGYGKDAEDAVKIAKKLLGKY